MTRLTKLSLGMILVLLSFLQGTANVEAVLLKPVANISITDASMSATQDSVTFKIRNNNPAQRLLDIKYGIRIQDKTGKLVTESMRGDVTFSSLAESPKIVESLPSFSNLSGKYDVFVIIKNLKGLMLALGYVGGINVESKKKGAALENCEITDISTQSFKCTIRSMKDLTVTYSLYKNSSYGELLTNGAVDFVPNATDTNEIELNLTESLSPGHYEIVFDLNDDSGRVYPHQQIIPFDISGAWVGITYLSSDFSGNSFNVMIRFAGAGKSEDRAFRYWILDSEESVCAHDVIELKNISPNVHRIKEELRDTCDIPRLVGVLYDGRDENGSYNIVESIGEADFTSLIKSDLDMKAKESKEKNSNPNRNNIVYLVIAVLIIISTVYYFVFMRKNGTGTIAVLAFVFLFLAPSAFVNADTFFSQDSPNVTFSVGFNRSEFAVGEDITFAFAFTDTNNNGRKPNGGSVSVSYMIDGEAHEEQIVDSSDNGSYYTVSLPGINDEGQHTLRFNSPDMCGSAFDYSLFGIAKFGSDDCDFDVDVVISQNGSSDERPTSPFVSGTCEESGNSISLFSSYLKNGTQANIYYDYRIDFEDGSSVTGRVPTLASGGGYVASGVDREVSFSGDVGSSYSVTIRATGDDGSTSFEKQQVIVCSDGDGDDEYSFGGSMCDDEDNFSIEADPGMVRRFSTSRIRWRALRGLRNCSISGTNGQSWLVGQQGDRETSTITEELTYTLSCFSVCTADNISTDTTINIAPIFEEI